MHNLLPIREGTSLEKFDCFMSLFFIKNIARPLFCQNKFYQPFTNRNKARGCLRKKIFRMYTNSGWKMRLCKGHVGFTSF